MTGSSRPQHSEIAGYDYGSPRCAKSPVSAGELLELEQTLEWTAKDAQLLRKHAALFEAQAERMVDSWRAVIGLRHTPDKKNKTDGRQTPPLVPLRYLLAFVPLVVGSFRHFFEDAITDRIELHAVERAWTKAVHLHVTLWTRPYSRDGLW
jgi:hypothetical protein